MYLYIRSHPVNHSGFPGSVLADPKNKRVPRNDLPYSFVWAPYIHPEIVRDLTSWPSDQGDRVVVINLSDSQESNRYFGEIRIRETGGQHPFVSVRGDNEDFSYQYIGMAESGLHILYTSGWGGWLQDFQEASAHYLRIR